MNRDEDFDNNREIRVFDAANKASVFIVDYGGYMRKENGRHQLLMAIKALRITLNDLCVTGNDREFAAVIFVNTGKNNTSARGIDNIYVHRELKPLNVEYIKELDAYLNDAENARSKFHEELGEPNICNWKEVIHLSKCFFRDSYKNRAISKKYLRIFSAQDVEGEMDPLIMQQIITNLNDLRRDKASITVCLMCKPEEKPDPSPFWLYFDEDPFFCDDVDESFGADIKRKEYALRSNTSVPFRVAEGVEIAVGIYYLVKPKSKPKYTMLDMDTDQRVECRTHFVVKASSASNKNGGGEDSDNAGEEEERDEPLSGDVKYALELGGETIVINKDEKELLRRLDEPGITLIGFKPLSTLKLSHRMGDSKFLFPLEAAIKGSATLYRALHKRCLERELFILARYTQKVNTAPKLVAIVPQASECKNKTLELDNYMMEGFHIFTLPFAEDSRSFAQVFTPPSEDGWPLASQKQVDAAKDFVKALTIRNFKPDAFPNPVNQHLYKAIETIALNLKIDEFKAHAKELDKIRPYYKIPEYEQRASQQRDRFVKLCGLQTTVKDEANESEVGTSSKKRGRPAATNKGGAKAKKTKASVNEEIDDDMKVKPEDFY